MPRSDRLTAEVVVSSLVERTPRVLQLEGLFDVPPSERAELRWSVELPLDEREWNIGLICGPSGSGKSTIARQLFGDRMTMEYGWPKDRSIVDGFPEAMPVKEITELLSSVGFSSPPSWLRPYRVLSTGEQFRISMARTLAEARDLAVVDEFTSVVDRTVAQIGSAAIARSIRRRGQQFVAVTCHMDVLDWLQPDWVYRPDLRQFQWRELHRFPSIKLDVFRVHHSAWQMFRQHHYLDTSLAKAAACFIAEWAGRPVAFSSWMPRFGVGQKAYREHRTVTLPDFQGVGIGNRLSEFCAGIWKALGYRVFSTTSHPGMIAYRNRSEAWRCVRTPSIRNRDSSGRVRRATARLTAGFRFIGPALDLELAAGLAGR